MKLSRYLTAICILSITTLGYIYFVHYNETSTHLKYIKYSLFNKLCIDQGLQTAWCRQEEVLADKIESNDNKLLDKIVRKKLKEKLKKEINQYKLNKQVKLNNKRNKQEQDTSLKRIDHEIKSTARPTKTTKTPSSTWIPTTGYRRKPQKCNIPIVDPFHREVRPYITYKWTQKCTLAWEKSRVEKGFLYVDLADVSAVNMSYIKRISDEDNELDTRNIYHESTSTRSKKDKLAIKLEDDFIRVDIKTKTKEKPFSEYLMYPVKKPPQKGEPPFKNYDAQKDKYNVLMVMTDSVSHACAQRYLTKTYKYLQENPHTVIMKGHTILGDATTPQISAMFFGGKPEHLTPEGRKGERGAQTIDSWPSIFKDYKKDGYVTMHSEDQAWIAAFNFRLMGFSKPPAHKYLRSWWQRSADLRCTNESRADSCPIKYVLNYYKDFRLEYDKELSLAYLSTSALTHNEPEKIHMFDEGFLNFFKDMKNSGKLDSTIVIFFGDHGMRDGNFRHTAQGTTEERLPFMSLTFPPRFYAEHPNKIRNLKRNSEVLTTPYDMHVTLKHILDLTKSPVKHTYGKSLFQNIVKHNRTCADAGVPFTWCVCTEFVPVQKNNGQVLNVAKEMVKTINNKLTSKPESRDRCVELELDSIIRAGILSLKHGDRLYDTYQIVFKVKPNGGIFESSAELNKKDKTIKVNVNFSRLNHYGKQPKCIEQRYPYLRKFCFCKDYIS
ncbi:uncharacterized protein [Clytia hemisphaerica]|uniref:Uncharacterized protein n=1 Tax=Clytia hemisphaerica TaxID=252671 RepID=A0A7M6DNB8_9CNID